MVLRAMNLDYEEVEREEGCFFIVESGLFIVLPPDNEDDVVINFGEDSSPNFAADISMRFSRIAEFADINIVVFPYIGDEDRIDMVDYEVEV